MRVAHLFDKSALPGSVCSGQRSCSCQSRSLFGRRAHPNQALAVIDEQPDVELDARQLGDRQPLDALAQSGASDGNGVDQV